MEKPTINITINNLIGTMIITEGIKNPTAIKSAVVEALLNAINSVSENSLNSLDKSEPDLKDNEIIFSNNLLKNQILGFSDHDSQALENHLRSTSHKVDIDNLHKH